MASAPELSEEQIVYLRSLRAVKKVSSNRIRYTEEFKKNCMERYFNGESPAAIFREAGLDSSIIGYKRIERCIARWRQEGYGLPEDSASDADGDQAEDAAGRGEARRERAREVRTRSIYKPGMKLRAKRNSDLRDILIAQQVRRIDELEHEIERLRYHCHELEKHGHDEHDASADEGSDAPNRIMPGTEADATAKAGTGTSGDADLAL